MTRSRWTSLALALAAGALAASCAAGDEPALPPPVAGFVRSEASGLEASWARMDGELVVTVAPLAGAGDRPPPARDLPAAGRVQVNGVERALVPDAAPGTVAARVPYAGSARELELALDVRDAAGNLLLRYVNEVDAGARARLEAWLDELGERAAR